MSMKIDNYNVIVFYNKRIDDYQNYKMMNYNVSTKLIFFLRRILHVVVRSLQLIIGLFSI